MRAVIPDQMGFEACSMTTALPEHRPGRATYLQAPDERRSKSSAQRGSLNLLFRLVCDSCWHFVSCFVRSLRAAAAAYRRD